MIDLKKHHCASLHSENNPAFSSLMDADGRRWMFEMDARETSSATTELQANHEGFGSFLRPWAFILEQETWQKWWCLAEKVGMDDGAQLMVTLVLGHCDLLLAVNSVDPHGWFLPIFVPKNQLLSPQQSHVDRGEPLGATWLPPPPCSCKTVRLEIQPYQSPLIALLPFHAMPQLGRKPGCKNLYVGENQRTGKTPICIRGGSAW